MKRTFVIIITLVLLFSTSQLNASSPEDSLNSSNASNSSSNHKIQKNTGWIVGPLAFVSVLIAVGIRKWKDKDKNNKTIFEDIIIGIWVICPPIWFFLEWAYLSYRPFDEFKYSQELARNIWLALVILLVAILKGKWPLGSD